MNKFVIKINGKYLKGYDETKSVGKVGNDGWQPRAYELPSIEFTKEKSEARILEGNINLKSDMDRIMNQIRFGGLEVNKLEVLKIMEE